VLACEVAADCLPTRSRRHNICSLICAFSQVFELAIKGLEVYQNYSSVLSALLDVIRDCVNRDRMRSWSRMNSPLAVVTRRLPANLAVRQYCPMSQLALTDVCNILSLHGTQPDFVSLAFEVRIFQHTALAFCQCQPSESRCSSLDSSLSMILVLCVQFIGQLAFIEADMLMDIDGLLLVTERANALIQDWRVALEFCRCLRELRFTNKPRVLSDFEVLPVMIKGVCR
jgi:hypothetical protein